MVRAQMCINIPQEYKDNEAKGLCKVCGKSKDKFDKLRRVYCSEDCAIKYSRCFMSWASFRANILKENNECVKCGSKSWLEVDHIIPVAITGIVFDEDNVQVLCNKCHKKKTKQDLKEIKKYKNKQTSLFK